VVVVVVVLLLVVVKEEAIFCIVESDGKPPEDNLEKKHLAIGCDLKGSATRRTLGIPFDFDARNCAFQVFLGCHEMSIVTS